MKTDHSALKCGLRSNSSNSSNLNWNQNTSNLIKDGNKRMQLLHKTSKFTNNMKDLKQIYISQVRSKLEQSAVVWHSSLSKKNENDIERVQKAALRIIMKKKYNSYEDALTTLKLKSLKDRREHLCLKFAKGCLKIEKFKKYFPLKKKEHGMLMRHSDKFVTEKFKSFRYRNSALPYMIRLLNKSARKKKDVTSLVSNFNVVPMNYDVPTSISLGK